MTCARRQRGVALITAMLIFALLGILAASLSWDVGLDMRRTMSMLFHDEGTQAAYGAEDWVRSLLRDDAIDSTTDHLDEIWAAEFPVLPIESDTVRGAIQGNVEDMQGRFNINNLVNGDGEVDPMTLEQFQRLLLALDLDPRFAQIVADWVDTNDIEEIPAGAEDPIYMGKQPPYLAANQTISNISELMAVDGMDRATFDALSPHISALPKLSSGEPTKINVNTATLPVLQSLGDSWSAADVEGLMSQREDGGFTDYVNQFKTYIDDAVINRLLDETSAYFQLKVVVQIDTVRVTYYSLLYRDSQGGLTIPVLRSFGTT